MRSCVVLLFASLLTLCEAQGTIVTPVFVLKGSDLLLKLHADPPEKFLFVDWKINKTVLLVRFNPSGEANVTGRVQLDENKFSVILKNVQEVDSGVYSAVVDTLKGNKTAAEYKVTVQGRASPVELIVDPVDSNSSESCYLHVTCRTHNAHISSIVRCVDRVCSQEGGERPEVTTSGASLQVYLLNNNNTIICKHNNQVHRILDFNTAEQHCYPSTDPHPLLGWVIASCILTVILSAILLIVAGVIVWLCIDRKRLIGLIQIYQATKEEAALDLEALKEKSASLKNRSPAEASGPSYSSVPSAAEPTDP